MPVAVFNQAGRTARRFGRRGGLSIDRMIAAAKRKTGLNDFGDDEFLEPLEILVKSINEEPRLSSVGYALQKSRIVSALSTRLRAQNLIGKHPEILDLDLGILSDHLDTREIAHHWVRKMRRMLERSMEVRNSGNADAFVDVSYYDLVSNPIDEVRTIYRHADIEFTGRVENASAALAARNVKDRHGKHIYSLSSFGLNAEEIDRNFAFYTRAFRVLEEGGDTAPT